MKTLSLKRIDPILDFSEDSLFNSDRRSLLRKESPERRSLLRPTRKLRVLGFLAAAGIFSLIALACSL